MRVPYCAPKAGATVRVEMEERAFDPTLPTSKTVDIMRENRGHDKHMAVYETKMVKCKVSGGLQESERDTRARRFQRIKI